MHLNHNEYEYEYKGIDFTTDEHYTHIRTYVLAECALLVLVQV